jgi:hypothetical protein
MNEIFDVEDGANVKTNFRTIFVSYTVWLVNKDPHNGFVIGPGHFGVHQLDSMIDCHLLGDCPNTLFNRTCSHCQPTSKKPVAQNKKWARTHRTKPPRSEQAVNYTER